MDRDCKSPHTHTHTHTHTTTYDICLVPCFTSGAKILKHMTVCVKILSGFFGGEGEITYEFNV